MQLVPNYIDNLRNTATRRHACAGALDRI